MKNMNNYFVTYKDRGETPLDVVNRIRKLHPELDGIKIGYAGRLDPMAEGILIILKGEENKRKSMYQKMDKEYEVQVVFGISTDSQDLLGSIESIDTDIVMDSIPDNLKKYIGTVGLPLPIYSGATQDGKKLFSLARKNSITHNDTALQHTTISSIEICNHGIVTLGELAHSALPIIKQIRGDFRQDAIIAQWEALIEDTRQLGYLTLRIEASSGTYMRSLARALGQDLGKGAIAAHIVRTRVGPYTYADANQDTTNRTTPS